jgi:hypothetical protein
MEQPQSFAEVVEQTIASLEADPEDTARQLAIVGVDILATNRFVADRLRHDPAEVALEEALTAEAWMMLAGAASIIQAHSTSEHYPEARMRARGVGLMLDEMAGSVRLGGAGVAQTMRSEIGRALEDFAGLVGTPERRHSD